MYGNYQYINRRGNDRFAGGFIGPFLLGGLTGGLVAPLFYNNRPYYGPTPYCGPYCNYYPYYR